jgi:hypothetical protein
LTFLQIKPSKAEVVTTCMTVNLRQANYCQHQININQQSINNQSTSTINIKLLPTSKIVTIIKKCFYVHT